VHYHWKYWNVALGTYSNSVCQPHKEQQKHTANYTILYNNFRSHILCFRVNHSIFVNVSIYIDLNWLNWYIYFTAECCHCHSKTCFRKRLRFITYYKMCNQTKPLNNKVQQQHMLVKTQFVIEELIFRYA